MSSCLSYCIGPLPKENKLNTFKQISVVLCKLSYDILVHISPLLRIFYGRLSRHSKKECCFVQGNYPYRSSYILNGIGTLPPFPMRVACEFMAEENPSDEAILRGLSKAAGVFYNYTGDVPCFNYRSLSLTPSAVSPTL